MHTELSQKKPVNRELVRLLADLEDGLRELALARLGGDKTRDSLKHIQDLIKKVMAGEE